jgi:hypothetical protein
MDRLAAAGSGDRGEDRADAIAGGIPLPAVLTG